ncbi:MAG: FimB/Mfa2 family fimbrial subunit [Alistipes sp.]
MSYNRSNLTFGFTKNEENTDKFPSEVKALEVYAFNTEGIYAANFKIANINHGTTPFTMPISLPLGEYTFVVWGGTMNTYTIKSNKTGKELEIGTSNFTEAQLAIKQQGTVIDYPLDDLYYGRADHVNLTQQELGTHFNLTKNTHLLNITLRGVDAPHTDVSCTASNGQFNFDNSLSESASMIQYKPFERKENTEELVAKFSILRLLSDSDCRLKVRNTATNEELYNENLVKQILKLPNINSDDDLDRHGNYNIVISINPYVGVTVSINGYIVTESGHDI